MHVRIKKFARFQQNYMITLEMADILDVVVLPFFCFFFGRLNINLVSIMKQHNLDTNLLQFVCIKTNVSLQIIKI